jgi:hypothetical protein
MPYGWNHITEGFDLDHTHGIARVTIKLNEDGPRVVPLRLVTRAGVRTVWPEAPCTLYGVWSYFTLREAVAHGAEIVEVHEARSYMMTCKPLASFVRAVWSKQGAIPRDSVRKALKGYSRRLNGRFAVSRWRSNLIPLSEYFDRIALDPDAGMPNMVIGDHCVVREPMDNYPAYSQILWSISTVDRATVILTRIEDELERAGLPVLYRDTDSVMFSARDLGGKPEVPDAVSARMGDGLGEWRVDWVGDWAIIMGSKFYALDDGTCSFAGVPRDIQAELLHNGRATYQQRATAFNPSRAVTFNLSAGELFERES